ncbi:MAG: hypothetical protein OEY52_07695 [Gammaproteobacteria bacterium]|nr:hypothetical protein [Gammaproteobacteria bacterium]
MRYRIGQEPGSGQEQAVGEDGLAIFTAIFSLFTGIGFIIAGIRGKQIWLAFWGGVMVLASLGYLGAVFIR